MKIGVIVPGEYDGCPYVKYFTNFFDDHNVKYDLYWWNRNGKENGDYKENFFVYQNESSVSLSKFSKFFDYLGFQKFVLTNLNKKKYDFIIVHTLFIAVLLTKLLKNKYHKRFVLDIRDYSPIIPFAKRIINNLIKHSFFTSISSYDFKAWLPTQDNLIISHNVSKELLLNNFEPKLDPFTSKDLIKVLVIGKLRNISSNIRLINDFALKQNVHIVFAGDGEAKDAIWNHISKYESINAECTGIYDKQEENEIVRKCDVIYNVLEDCILENHLLSNRFYLSLINKKPMIVNRESYHSYFVNKYDLGVVVDKNDNIYEKLIEYKNSFNQEKFLEGCNALLSIIKEDILEFEKKLKQML